MKRSLPVLSASQYKTYLECLRKWSFKYIDGFEEPPTASSLLGVECHKVAEAWLRDGAMPDMLTKEGAIISAGLKHLPLVCTGDAEHAFTLETSSSSWRGVIDWIGPIGDVWTVLDHKTTGDFKWAKDEESLTLDPQAVLYAAYALERYPQTDKIMLKWVYYRTKGSPASKAVSAVVHRRHVKDLLKQLDAGAKVIQELYALRLPTLELPPSYDACDNFGGCPHKHRCNITIAERWSAPMASANEQIEAILAKRNAAKAVASPAPPAPPAPPPPAPPVQVESPHWPPAGWYPNPNREGWYYTAEGKEAHGDELIETIENASAVNPPEAPSRAPASPEEMEGETLPAAEVSVENMGREAAKALAVRMGLVQESSKLRVEALRSLIVAALEEKTPSPTPVFVPAPALKPKPRPEPRPEALPTDKWTYVLYINCLPQERWHRNPEHRSADVYGLADFLTPVLAKLNRDTGLDHYTHEDYGKGPGRLAALLQQHILEVASLPEGIVVDSCTKEGADCLPVLIRNASSIVRGF